MSSRPRSRFEELLNAIAKNDSAEVSRANSNLESSLNSLGDVVAREDWPAWLVDLIGNTSNYRTNHNNGLATWIAHLKSLMKNWSKMDRHQWFKDERKSNFDVDKIIESARSEFRINELFDRLIETLRELCKCEELDSAKALKDLDEIIVILQKAQSGTFAAQVATWQFVRRFVPNLISAYIKRSDISGPAIEAFEQTANELYMNIGAAKDRISNSMLDAAKSSFHSAGLNSIEANHIPALPELDHKPE